MGKIPGKMPTLVGSDSEQNFRSKAKDHHSMKGQTIFLTDKGPNMIGKKFFIVVDMRPEAEV